MTESSVERDDLVMDIVSNALQEPVEDREGYLCAACKGDEALFRAGLAEAHRSGVIHRDLKTVNITVCRKGVDSYRELERSMKVGVPFVAPHRPKKPGGRDCHCRAGNVPLDTKPPEASPISTGPGRLTN